MTPENLTPRPDPATFAWSDAFLIGFSEMDDTHREFVEVVRSLLDANASSMQQCMQDFIDHAQNHFGEEDVWMRDTDFPAADCHIAEHAEVLRSAHAVLDRAKSGDVATVRRFAEELTRWFPAHADYLDSALAAWMVKRRHGGKPVVLRRQIG
ncbi:MAG: hemerythrin domain-containing protein [Hydrogenophaga sp.]|uniref:bacteriohemerythrin n=1 Tax=Hydrogenophaga sp. TaxID=1904254 RepID=UPI002777E48D|nr:hemerythrin domain-containing protein [Hydrogenophaga sp.]MDP2419365.1 hemerythrin domain-containing protein [Hydrogenophaga sp.]MDZ4174823.1 hemerythrin domain-containing protein [Hydrogenophaga sp.]